MYPRAVSYFIAYRVATIAFCQVPDTTDGRAELLEPLPVPVWDTVATMGNGETYRQGRKEPLGFKDARHSEAEQLISVACDAQASDPGGYLALVHPDDFVTRIHGLAPTRRGDFVTHNVACTNRGRSHDRYNDLAPCASRLKASKQVLTLRYGTVSITQSLAIVKIALSL